MNQLLLKRGFEPEKIVRLFSSISCISLPPYDYIPRKYAGPSKEMTINKMNKHLFGPYVSKKMLIAADQKMQYIYDLTGKRCLNAFDGKCGSRHPVENFFMKLYTSVTQYEKVLASKLHGNLKGTILEVVNPYSDGMSYAKNVNENFLFKKFGCVAGFIGEAIQGVGAVKLVPEYLKLAYDIICKAGGVWIDNEVHIVFGRIESHYWGFEAHDVCQDIIIIDDAGLEDGFLLGVVVGTQEIENTMAQIQFEEDKHYPAGIANGLLLFEILEKEKLQEHCLQVDVHLVERLVALQQRHDLTGNARGRGMMVRVEVTHDVAETVLLSKKLEEIGVLIGRGGLYGNVFKNQTTNVLQQKRCRFPVRRFRLPTVQAVRIH